MYLRWKKIMRVILFDLLTFKWYSWLLDISVSIFQHSWWRKLRNVEGPNAPKRSYFVVWCVSLDWPADHPPPLLHLLQGPAWCWHWPGHTPYSTLILPEESVFTSLYYFQRKPLSSPIFSIFKMFLKCLTLTRLQTFCDSQFLYTKDRKK